MDATQQKFTISCHCGAASQTLTRPDGDGALSHVSFCHCDTCRHLTGVLCTSYVPVSSSSPPSLHGLERYSTSPSSGRYFCSTCGCHVFRATRKGSSASPEQWSWQVATGTITDAPKSDLPSTWTHRHGDDTVDGGFLPWFPRTVSASAPSTPPPGDNADTVEASCHCKSISLLITRPSADPALNPDSPYPDLLFPYCSTPADVVSNPSCEKWHLRAAVTQSPSEPSLRDSQNDQHLRYLAGTCACRSCRLTSGFEIQTWAFVPRQNIFISSASSSSASPGPDPDSPPTYTYQPLNFPLPPNIPLKEYESTPHRRRSFCAVCGATIFWRSTSRAITPAQSLPPDTTPVAAAPASTTHTSSLSTDISRATTTRGTTTETTPSNNSNKDNTSGSSNNNSSSTSTDSVARPTSAASRPDLMDLSAGLFRPPSGSARAEAWLSWHTGRVSFAEEASNGRTGAAAGFGVGVVRCLEEGFAREREAQGKAVVSET